MINWVCSLTCYSGTNRQCSLLLHRHILCYTNGTSNIFCSRWLNQKFSNIVLLHSHLNIRDEIHSVLRYHRIISLCLSIIYNEWLIRKVFNCNFILYQILSQKYTYFMKKTCWIFWYLLEQISIQITSCQTSSQSKIILKSVEPSCDSTHCHSVSDFPGWWWHQMSTLVHRTPIWQMFWP